MSDSLKETIVLEDGFRFNEVRPDPKSAAPPPPPAPLGDLLSFTDVAHPDKGKKFHGSGFNLIFRPQNPATPTQLPVLVPGSDNILELNLTRETLTFSAALGNVPNRGSAQGDISLNAVPYVQSIEDVTVAGSSPGIHFEPGMWLAVPPTTNPNVNQTICTRMASIPHGTTIVAQGTSTGKINGSPLANILPVNVNPFSINGAQPPIGTHNFASQTLTTPGTARLPQDLTAFNTAGTITQFILDDPNTVLRNQLKGVNVQSFIALQITTDAAGALPTPAVPPTPPAPTPPGFGGGTDDIAFLLGDNNSPPLRPNANAFKMTAIFWIETIQVDIMVGPLTVGQQFAVEPAAAFPGQTVPTFVGIAPFDVGVPRKLTVTYTQIQYTQTVFLNFNKLTWPHVSVATLVPSGSIEVPASAWK